MSDCTHCGRDLSGVRSVYLQRDSYVEPIRVGQFCSYACLTEYVEERGLAGEPPEPTE